MNLDSLHCFGLPVMPSLEVNFAGNILALLNRYLASEILQLLANTSRAHKPGRNENYNQNFKQSKILRLWTDLPEESIALIRKYMTLTVTRCLFPHRRPGALRSELPKFANGAVNSVHESMAVFSALCTR